MRLWHDKLLKIAQKAPEHAVLKGKNAQFSCFSNPLQGRESL